MDAESVAQELYGLRPAEFTAARDEYVARARQAGDKELAAAIARLRKPTVAAWTADLLARSRPEEARQLVHLGEALRAAHRALDGEQLRQLSRDQHVVIAELARTGRELAAEAGQAVSESALHEVEQILRAALADEAVAREWTEGRLVKSPEAAVGFAGLEPAPGTARPPARSPARPAGPAAERAAPERRERRERWERWEAARKELAEATEEADRLEGEQAAAGRAAEQAHAAVESAEDEVKAANERLGAARAEDRQALARRQEAGRAASKARARAESAGRRAEKLPPPPDA
ncbi:hypothetical protein [Streptomyces sp. NPDC002054]|uniref:hypothetical protein n=1 Tax=Streptomyces sp. NPDC002054 TaxID=3154663 RepID=UPI003320DC75